ncbi:NUDIX hydrolase [Parafrankia colletiae]|uniref:NUDIX hydrolase n=1 Tax=Parafrankia colletiae TaxID=573497 RepID=A0A1S1QIR0_9ACTN|nr:NUDIX domain-containing protein [Parafrankia colletiae]MCK9901461.1 NUDIX domain-containing protein [Frankia sp. Cpl3]OHV33496.1 NUDIX hydrolase [Parafrankia colletiae]
MTQPPSLVPAASAVLLRDRPSGPEVLMLRRSLTASFAPGAWVFPGGRVDAGDGDVDGGIVGAASAELAAARRAAVRETAEEAGLVIDGAALIPLARWCPPATAARRFLTWILLGRAPDQPVAVDGGEITEHCWVRPAEALAARDRGDLDLLPPTWVTLWTLTPHASVEDVLTSAAAAPPELFETRFVRVAEGLVAMWHGDGEYDDAADTTRHGARHRLWMLNTGWRYERHA